MYNVFKKNKGMLLNMYPSYLTEVYFWPKLNEESHAAVECLATQGQ